MMCVIMSLLNIYPRLKAGKGSKSRKGSRESIIYFMMNQFGIENELKKKVFYYNRPVSFRIVLCIVYTKLMHLR